MLKRKIDKYLEEWKASTDKKPLIVKGARQVGKTASIRYFGEKYYNNIVEINFALQPKYKQIFADGYEVDSIIKNITLLNPTLVFVPHETLLFFDELQEYPDCATSLKSFKQDGRYDVICSGSLMGLYYQQIESNSVGYKTDYEMYSLDFEEFLWAKGYDEHFIDDLYQHMLELKPLSNMQMDVLGGLFSDYMILGGMPEVVNRYIESGQFSGLLQLQRQLLQDYEEDITKYASGFDKAKVLAVYRHITTFLAAENKRFQVTKIARGARNREYIGAVEWLANAGIINICYCLQTPSLPLKGNYDAKLYKVYYRDTGLLIASLDEEAQEDLRVNRNFGTYKGAIFENIVADMLAKQGYDLYYYRSESPSLEMDFFVRDAQSLIPVEVKAKDNATASLNRLISSDKEKYDDIQYGIKLCNKNIGFNGKFYTFPYFLTFLLRRFLKR
ncbi:MAG: ATP-binding protein [Paludibacteraceae bacterium]|nr:ATP-binding protein [Paludibacteraceae bacterium]